MYKILLYAVNEKMTKTPFLEEVYIQMGSQTSKCYIKCDKCKYSWYREKNKEEVQSEVKRFRRGGTYI